MFLRVPWWGGVVSGPSGTASVEGNTTVKVLVLIRRSDLSVLLPPELTTDGSGVLLVICPSGVLSLLPCVGRASDPVASLLHVFCRWGCPRMTYLSMSPKGFSRQVWLLLGWAIGCVVGCSTEPAVKPALLELVETSLESGLASWFSLSS